MPPTVQIQRQGRGLLPPRLVFLALCEDCIGVTESAGPNRGHSVDFFLRLAERNPSDAEAWCAASMNAIAEVACEMIKDMGSPLERVPLQAYVPSYYKTGEELGWLTETPAPGDLFLLWHAGLRRFRHMGCVRWMHPDGTFQTAEGNSNEGGSAEGKAFVSLNRKTGPRDVFLNPWGD